MTRSGPPCPVITHPSSASAPAQTPAESSAPSTLTGWVRRITEYCDEHHQYLSTRQTKNLAAKINRRADRMQWVPSDLIRSMLTYLDPTGEAAVREVMAERRAS